MSRNTWIRAAVCSAPLAVPAATAIAQQDLLPDIIVRESDLYDNDIQLRGNGLWLRLSNGTANIGDGKLYLYGGEINNDGTRQVIQRIYRDDGSSWEREAGVFVHHDDHNHIHFEEWSIYRLREVLDGGGVGPIVREGEKTSFCIIDLAIYDRSLPNFDPDGQFHSCNSTVQGLSVGWIDIYGKHLQGQRIDITGVEPGTYWLESEVDPFDRVLERDETNNITRVLVTIGDDGPDVMEPNDSIAQVDRRPEGGNNSPNLGPCGPERVIGGLTIHDEDDEDLFRFYMNDTGAPGDEIGIEFDASEGDLDLALLDDAGLMIRYSHSSGGDESISLEGIGEGWYYALVLGFDDATSTGYSLTVNPSQNAAPAVDVLTPPEGDTVREHGGETYQIDWHATDPEGDSTWATVYLNHHPEIDEHAIMLPSSLNTPGEVGFHIINSADVPPDTYWAIVELTDGGTVVASTSPGTISFVEICNGDFNRDGSRDTLDVLEFLNAWVNGEPEADFNSDGTINTIDVTDFLTAWNGPCE